MTEKRIEMKITGFVQGVFLRQGVKAEAERLGLTGWVRNEPDGSVRVVAEGSDEDLQKFAEWCRKGTEFARVEKVEIEWREARESLRGFTIQ